MVFRRQWLLLPIQSVRFANKINDMKGVDSAKFLRICQMIGELKRGADRARLYNELSDVSANLDNLIYAHLGMSAEEIKAAIH